MPNKRTFSLALIGCAAIVSSGVTILAPASAQSLVKALVGVVTCSSSLPCAGWSNTGTGTAIQGTATATDGIKGFSSGAGKSGVYGETDAAGGGYGVHGANSSANGSAVYGLGRAGIGVNATSTGKEAVFASTTANGVADAVTAVAAGGGFGVRGSSGTNAEGAVGAFATTGYGVFAQSTSGIGVYGASVNGQGAYLLSTNLDGLDAYSFGAGGNGDAASGADIGSFGTSNEQYHADGMHVYSASGNGAVISAGSYSATGVEAFTADLGSKAGAIIGGVSLGVAALTGGGSNSIPLEAGAATSSGTGTGFFYVDGTGNVHYTGTLISYARTRSGANATAFETKATRATVEDSGSAQLVGGSALITLDPAYAQAIDLTTAYRVFLTPDGDTRGLYVAQKTATSFLVRETQGGHGTFAFDYRILAAAPGHAAERMALVTPALQSKLFPMLNSHGALAAPSAAPHTAPALKAADPGARVASR